MAHLKKNVLYIETLDPYNNDQVCSYFYMYIRVVFKKGLAKFFSSPDEIWLKKNKKNYLPNLSFLSQH